MMQVKIRANPRLSSCGMAESSYVSATSILQRFLRWFHGQRSSTPLSFLLQIICRAGFSVFSFIWTPLLLASMGKSLNGLFLNFQKITTPGDWATTEWKRKIFARRQIRARKAEMDGWRN